MNAPSTSSTSRPVPSDETAAEPAAEPPSSGDATSGDRLIIEPDCWPDTDLVWFARHLRRAINELKRPVERVCILIVNDARMTELHRLHMDVEDTTDVLTFPHNVDADAPIDVDIAICIDEARRQAALRSHGTEAEMLLYAVHGLLHCTTFDDHEPADAQRMHAEEDRILNEIGVGTVFDRHERGERAP